MPLPAKEMSLFAFPYGLRLEFANENKFPLPVFFTFVFTNADGDHYYAACLRFYEKISSDNVQVRECEIVDIREFCYFSRWMDGP